MSNPLAQPQQVRAILPTLDTRIDPTPFIATAHAMMDQHLIIPNLIMNLDGTPNTVLLTQIELWLSAHFCAVADPMRSSESGVGVSASRKLPEAKEGLEATFPGRQVMALDYTGTLAVQFTRKRPLVLAAFGTGMPLQSPVRVVQT